MGKKEDFHKSLKVDQATLDKIAAVSKNYNSNSKKKSSNEDGGREIGDEGPGGLGRESALKGGNKTSKNVLEMRADMKAKSNNNAAKGKLSQNGKNVNNSGKMASPTISGNVSAGKVSTTSATGKSISGGGHSGGGHGGGHSGGGHGGH